MPSPRKSDTPRSDAITVTTTEENPAGNAVLAAWQGIYHLFGGEAKFEITDDGVQVSNFTTDAKYNPEQIVEDIGHRNRRLDLIPLYQWITGNKKPDPFTDPKEITQFMVQYFRGSVEEGSSRSPRYVRDAVAAWKSAHNMAKKRGPKRKVFRLDNLNSLDKDALAGVDQNDLQILKELLESQLAANAENNADTNSEATSNSEEAVGATS